MEDSTKDPRRMMCIGRFTFKWAYQYYTSSRGVLKKWTKDRLHWYTADRTEFYFEGEEDAAWNKIKKEFHETATNKVLLKDKNIEWISNSGYSKVDKEGNIL